MPVVFYQCNSPLQKRERSGISFLYWLDWKSKHFNWNVTEWKATQSSLRVFSGKLSKWEPCKSCKIPYKPSQILACLQNPYKLSILGDIWTAIIFHFNILLFQTNRKQPHSFPVLSRFCNGLFVMCHDDLRSLLFENIMERERPLMKIDHVKSYFSRLTRFFL